MLDEEFATLFSDEDRQRALGVRGAPQVLPSTA
jgi:hypothetical protein